MSSLATNHFCPAEALLKILDEFIDLLFLGESIKDDAYSAFVIETSGSDEFVGNSHVGHDAPRALENL